MSTNKQALNHRNLKLKLYLKSKKIAIRFCILNNQHEKYMFSKESHYLLAINKYLLKVLRTFIKHFKPVFASKQLDKLKENIICF